MKNNKSFSAVILILVISGIIGFSFYFSAPVESKDSPIKNFPLEVGNWKAQDIPLDERVYDLLETKNLIMRDYQDSRGRKINFYVIYSQDNRKVSHPPEICLQGDGAAVVEKTPLKISSAINANKLVMEKKHSRELAVYWYKAGSHYTANYVDQQIRMSWDRLLGKKTSLALIRVIALVENNNDQEALSRIREFCALIAPLLSKYAP
ncbi:MAG: EpsI family protein [Candidatus Omnitrophica bacterium]|nr:EpsI family protein [Candidatus Omnitrophota bacterium]